MLPTVYFLPAVVWLHPLPKGVEGRHVVSYNKHYRAHRHTAVLAYLKPVPRSPGQPDQLISSGSMDERIDILLAQPMSLAWLL